MRYVLLSQHRIDRFHYFHKNHSAEKLDLYNKVSIFSVCIIFPCSSRNNTLNRHEWLREWMNVIENVIFFFCCHSQQLAYSNLYLWIVCMLVGKTNFKPFLPVIIWLWTWTSTSYQYYNMYTYKKLEILLQVIIDVQIFGRKEFNQSKQLIRFQNLFFRNFIS